jgi:DNA-binding Lrp family transcriptional regulator
VGGPDKIAVFAIRPAHTNIRGYGGSSPRERTAMVTAIVLLKAEIHRIPEVAEAIAQLPAVSEVYSITGDYDLVAIVRVRSHDDLADVIPGGLNKVDGVSATQTHVAFRAYSRHDLEAAFSIGLAE